MKQINIFNEIDYIDAEGNIKRCLSCNKSIEQSKYMKAKTEFVSNFKEIEQAHQLGYDVPEPETTIIDFNFDVNGVVAYYINNDGNINLSLYGEMWTVQYDKDIIAALDKHINK
jgi:hypothetical protein